jgi:hypothetical protein
VNDRLNEPVTTVRHGYHVDDADRGPAVDRPKPGLDPLAVPTRLNPLDGADQRILVP